MAAPATSLRRTDPAPRYAGRVILYHFPTSPFARRARIALVHKGLAAELRDARAVPEHMAEVRRLNPFHTVPVLVDGDRVVADSTAILHYLDRKVPSPPLWPAGLAGAEAFEIIALVDGALTILSGLGLRYAALSTHAEFPQVRDVAVGRAQRGLDALAGRSAARGAAPLCGDRWSAADMALFTMVTWIEGLPARAETFPPVRPLLALGWTLPPALSTWADAHRRREDVLALG
jgi:glutathione S-transferase